MYMREMPLALGGHPACQQNKSQ